MKTELYNLQADEWPQEGNHILAQYDAESIIVYQAYKPSIGHYAAKNGYFGGDFSFNRMSWIKPNFLWMMYRCGWARKEGQEVVLAVTIPRTLFDEILEKAVASTFSSSHFKSQEEWKQSLASSEVRLQWDPDHSPTGDKVSRRAIQLGLRGDILLRYAKEEVLNIEDVTEFVTEQAANINEGFQELRTPEESIYTPSSGAAISNVKLWMP